MHHNGGIGPPSLFVISLPRSCSSIVYQAARRALGLLDPDWTTDGEILNADRMGDHPKPPDVGHTRYTTRDADRGGFDRLLGVLDRVVEPTAFAYKDVVQPFVVAEWLPAQDLRILRVIRPLADVAFAMEAWGWAYPGVVAGPGRTADAALVEGLRLAETALGRVPSRTINFDDLILDEGALGQCLVDLYPGTDLRPTGYIDDRFKQERMRQLARRASPRYRALQALVDAS